MMFHLFLSAMILAFTCGLPLSTAPKKNEYPKGEAFEFNKKDFGDMSKVSAEEYVKQIEDGLPCYTSDLCTKAGPATNGETKRWSLGKFDCAAQIKYCDWDDQKRCHLNAKYGDRVEYKMMTDGFGCGSNGEWLEITDEATCRAAMIKLCIFNDDSDIIVAPGSSPIKYPRGCYEKYTSTNPKKQYYFNPGGNVYAEGEYPQYEKYAATRLSICVSSAEVPDEDEECCWAETSDGRDLKKGEWDEKKGCTKCSLEECSTHANEEGVEYFAYTDEVYGGFCKVPYEGYNLDLSTYQGYGYKLYKCEVDNCEE